jgi:hypothetical protein
VQIEPNAHAHARPQPPVGARGQASGAAAGTRSGGAVPRSWSSAAAMACTRFANSAHRTDALYSAAIIRVGARSARCVG